VCRAMLLVDITSAPSLCDLELRIFLLVMLIPSGCICIARAKNFRERPTFLSVLAISLAATELLMCSYSLSCLAP
jgi:hypothetical protein